MKLRLLHVNAFQVSIRTDWQTGALFPRHCNMKRLNLGYTANNSNRVYRPTLFAVRDNIMRYYDRDITYHVPSIFRSFRIGCKIECVVG